MKSPFFYVDQELILNIANDGKVSTSFKYECVEISNSSWNQFFHPIYEIINKEPMKGNNPSLFPNFIICEYILLEFLYWHVKLFSS